MMKNENIQPRRKVRGKGKGGAGTKYCTMSPWKRKEHFPGHPLNVRTNDLGIEVLWCDACGCPVSHTTKSTIQGHGAWGGGSIGALLFLAKGVMPLLLNHSRRVRLPYHTLHVEPGPSSSH